MSEIPPLGLPTWPPLRFEPLSRFCESVMQRYRSSSTMSDVANPDKVLNVHSTDFDSPVYSIYIQITYQRMNGSICSQEALDDLTRAGRKLTTGKAPLAQTNASAKLMIHQLPR